MQGKNSSTNNSCHLYPEVSETPNTVHHPLTCTIFWRLFLVMGAEGGKQGEKTKPVNVLEVLVKIESYSECQDIVYM